MEKTLELPYKIIFTIGIGLSVERFTLVGLLHEGKYQETVTLS